MEIKMLFQMNARVLAADGQQVGHVARIVLNPETKIVTHIVAHTDAFLRGEDKVVPIDQVAGTARDHIVLSEKVGDMHSLPDFEERRIVDSEGGVERPKPAQNVGTIVPGFPAGVSIGPTPGDKFSTVLEQNIPEGTVALQDGANVITAEGKKVGKVQRILAEVPADRATHLLVSRGMFIKETKLIPMNWAETINESEVHLRVRKESFEELANAPLAA